MYKQWKVGITLIWFLAGLVGICSAAMAQDADDREKVLRRQIQIYEKELASKPDDPTVLFNLGNKCYELGRHLKERSGGFFRSEKKNRDAEEAHELFDSSIKYFEKTLQQQPENSGAHFNLALNYHEKNNGEDAIIHMRRAKEIFLKKKDLRGLAKAKKALRGWYQSYGYRPEDFDLGE